MIILRHYEKQDRLLEQLKENQDRIVQAIEFDPKRAITFEGEKIPEIEWEGEEEEGEDEEEEKEKQLIWIKVSTMITELC